MSRLEALVAATLADPLAAARAHAASGGRVIGYYTCNVPVELILAAGAFPLHLPHLTDGQTPRADRYMEPLFDRALRSVFDRWLVGEFAFVDSVVLPRSQDSAQRVYYYVTELIRTGEISGPQARLFDLLKVPRAASESYTLRSTRSIAADLGATPGPLTGAIERMNVRRNLLAGLTRQAAEARTPDGGFVTRVLATGLHAEPQAFDDALAEWLDMPTRSARRGPRIALLGSTPPDERLHTIIEEGGGVVTGEHHLLGPGRHGPAIAAGSDPFVALSMSYHAHVATVRDFGKPLDEALAQWPNLDGAIMWLTEEDDALAWQAPGLVRAARAIGLPLLALTRQDWLVTESSRTAILEFVNKLGAQ